MTGTVDQDVGNGLRPNHYHCVEIHQSAAQLDYILKLVIKLVGVDGLEQL